VPDALGQLRTGRDRRHEAEGQHHVARAHARLRAADAAAHDHVERFHGAVGLLDRPDVHHARVVDREVVQPARHPLQVVVELEPGRKDRLVVDEVGEPALALQVGEERERARRVAHRDEILEERDLHRRGVDEHPPVPAELLLAFEEADAQRPAGAPAVVLLDGDSERQVGGPEADAHEVVHLTGPVPGRGVARARHEVSSGLDGAMPGSHTLPVRVT
jgi:hypothetical protein